jgi:hypothetical protein
VPPEIAGHLLESATGRPDKQASLVRLYSEKLSNLTRAVFSDRAIPSEPRRRDSYRALRWQTAEGSPGQRIRDRALGISVDRDHRVLRCLPTVLPKTLPVLGPWGLGPWGPWLIGIPIPRNQEPYSSGSVISSSPRQAAAVYRYTARKHDFVPKAGQQVRGRRRAGKGEGGEARQLPLAQLPPAGLLSTCNVLIWRWFSGVLTSDQLFSWHAGATWRTDRGSGAREKRCPAVDTASGLSRRDRRGGSSTPPPPGSRPSSGAATADVPPAASAPWMQPAAWKRTGNGARRGCRSTTRSPAARQISKAIGSASGSPVPSLLAMVALLTSGWHSTTKFALACPGTWFGRLKWPTTSTSTSTRWLRS